MELKTFTNEQFGNVRTVMTEDNEPLFCLSDICKILKLDASQVMKRIDDGVVSIHPIKDSLNRTRQANFVKEDGLYDTILESRKPEAKAFRKWITHDVIPSIRKTGQYSTSQKPLIGAEYLLQQAQLMVEQERRLSAVESRMDMLEQERRENGIMLLALPLEGNPVPEESTRDKCREIVNIYNKATNTSQEDIWHMVYNSLYYKYHISVNNIRKIGRESNIAALERLGHIRKVYDILCEMCRSQSIPGVR